MALNLHKWMVVGIVALVVVVGCIPATTEAAIVRRPPNNLNLKAYWSLNEGTSTIATDFSRNYATGTLTNFAAPATATSGWGAGKFGKGLYFDGTDDYIQTAYKPTGYSAITISAWVNLSSASSYPMIVSHGANGDSALELRGSVSTGKIECVNRSNNTGVVDSVSAVGTGWHHYACVGIGTNFTLYKDGVSLGSAGISHGLTSTVNLRIGRRSDDMGGSFYFPGKIDEVRVYSSALTASEVMTLYRSGVTTFSSVQKNPVTSGLIGLWSFDGRDVVNGGFLDTSSAGTHPAYMGPTMATSTAYAPGRIGQAMKFDGTDDYMQVPNSADFDFGTNNFTISWWEYRTGNDNGSPSINRMTAVGDYTPFMLGYSNGGSDLLIYMSSALGAWDVANGEILGPVVLNQWVHYVVKRSGTTFTTYANGAQTNTWESALTLANAGGTDPEYDLTFGSYQNVYFFKGTLDDIRIYSRAVTADEVTQMYASGAGAVSKMNMSKNSLLTSGLFGLWSFDGPDVVAGSTAYDRSVGGFDGSLSGMSATAAVPGKVGQALYFDGTDDYVDASGIAASGFFGGAHTLSVWGKLDQWNANRTLIGGGITTENAGYSEIDFNNSDQKFYCRAWQITGGDTNDVASLNTYTNDGGWHHFAMTVNAAGNITGCYIDGVSQGTASNNNDLSFIDAFYVGQLPYPGANINPWSGRIDSARVYSRALSATEVLALYNAEK